MQVYVEDLLQIKPFSSARLLAGREGLGQPITRPYICLSPSCVSSLSGGELVFVPLMGSSFPACKLGAFFKKCKEKGVSGLTLVHNRKDLEEGLEERIVKEAGQLSLPLLSLPPKADLSSLTLEVYKLLERNGRMEENSRYFLENVLFERFQRPDDIVRMAKFYDIRLMPVYFIGILGNSLNTHSAEFTGRLIPSALRRIREWNKNAPCFMIPVTFSDTVLVLAFAPDETAARAGMEALSQLCQNLRALYLNAEAALSFSRVHERLTEIPDSYREASQTLLMLKSANYPSYILKYEDLGITRLLFGLSDTAEVERYCMENLKPILDYDREHSSDLLYTLKGYFMNNRHLVNTSNALYVHRNTLVYRLSLIKDLLDRDLDNAMTALELFNSILIYEFLQSREGA